MQINIRKANDTDLEAILAVEKAAFNRNDEANLVKQLINDESAKPFLSLIALVKDKIVAHVLFTKAYLNETSQAISISLLAPMAVMPDFQKQGIGSLLIEEGLKRLKNKGVELVFVLGYPEYYHRFGFQSAIKLGFKTPYPIPQEHIDGWMVMSLKENIINSLSGQIVCADAINKPEYWID